MVGNESGLVLWQFKKYQDKQPAPLFPFCFFCWWRGWMDSKACDLILGYFFFVWQKYRTALHYFSFLLMDQHDPQQFEDNWHCWPQIDANLINSALRSNPLVLLWLAKRRQSPLTNSNFSWSLLLGTKKEGSARKGRTSWIWTCIKLQLRFT